MKVHCYRMIMEKRDCENEAKHFAFCVHWLRLILIQMQMQHALLSTHFLGHLLYPILISELNKQGLSFWLFETNLKKINWFYNYLIMFYIFIKFYFCILKAFDQYFSFASVSGYISHINLLSQWTENEKEF